MSSQEFFDLSDGSKPAFLRELDGDVTRKIKKPAPRPPKETRKLHNHFALVHLNKPQLRPPTVKKLAPWPEYCHDSASELPWMKFDDKKAIDKWLAPTNGKAYKIWLCPACKKLHYIPYPQDITGTTSGKNIRSNQFRIRMGESPEKVYELETTTPAA